jgi:hypothetical protein
MEQLAIVANLQLSCPKALQEQKKETKLKTWSYTSMRKITHGLH